MAEVRTLVFTTCKHLLALDYAQVFALRVTGSSPELLLDWTAYLLARMLVARFELLAHDFAFELFELLDLIFTHHLSSFRKWVVDFETGYFHTCFTTLALVVNHLLASHAVSVVTLQIALMFAARKESLTESTACRNRFCAVFSLSTNQFFDRIVTARAEVNTRWVALTRTTGSTVTLLFTRVLPAVKLTPANQCAAELWLTAFQLLTEFTTEAL
jgi:hypothetical protein